MTLHVNFHFEIYLLIILIFVARIECDELNQKQVSDHLVLKRYFPVSSYASKNQQQIRDSILERFHLNPNTIIRTHDSRNSGAKYINETEFPSIEDCLYWCWETSPCNLAVYEDKTRGSCYLFDCGPNEDFRCKFTPHNFYTSSILQINRHPYDLSQWGSQVQHENELTKLRSKNTIAGTTSNPLVKSSTTDTHSLIAPSFLPVTSTTMHSKPSRCQHFQFECRNTSECIAIYNVCDGIAQCTDGSDEAPDMECLKSRYPTNPTHSYSAPNSGSLSQTYSKQTIPKLSDSKSLPELSNAPHSSAFSKDKQTQHDVPLYNYPKSPDAVENAKLGDNQNMFPKKHSTILQNGDLNNGNGYPSQYRDNWNQYYQQGDVYNGGDPRTGSGYLIEPEYLNSYSRDRDSSSVSGNYWPSIGRQPMFDTSDQLQGQSILPLSKSRQNLDEWQQTSNRELNYYDRPSKMGNYNRNEMKTDIHSKPLSQDFPPKINSKISQPNLSPSLTSDVHDPKENIGTLKYDSKLKVQTQVKAQPSYMASNKGISHSENIVAVSYMHDTNEQTGRETNSAVIALTLGSCITLLLVFLVGCRMKSIKRKIARRGRTLAHDADYLVNGMYL